MQSVYLCTQLSIHNLHKVKIRHFVIQVSAILCSVYNIIKFILSHFISRGNHSINVYDFVLHFPLLFTVPVTSNASRHFKSPLAMGEMPFKIKRASSVPISVVIDTGVNSNNYSTFFPFLPPKGLLLNFMTVIIMLGSKGILTPLIPDCYVLCTGV